MSVYLTLPCEAHRDQGLRIGGDPVGHRCGAFAEVEWTTGHAVCLSCHESLRVGDGRTALLFHPRGFKGLREDAGAAMKMLLRRPTSDLVFRTPPAPRMKILVVGHGRHGKDTCCEELAAATGLTNAGTTSLSLAEHVARERGQTAAQAYAERHDNRQFWRDLGDRLRQGDPAFLVRDRFEHGDITGGCRGFPEIQAVVLEKLADLVIWVEAGERLPPDPTMDFGREWADVVIDNNGSEYDFRARVRRLGALLKGAK